MIIAVAVVLVIGGGLAAVFSVLRFQKDVRDDLPSEFSEMEPDVKLSDRNGVERNSFDLLSEMKSDKDLSSILKDWALNDTGNSVMYDDDVLNILLMGIDATGGNSDVIMLASVNQKTKKIYLSSIMRDSYTYIRTPNGEGFGKINSAYGNGGADCLVQTVENDFKIRVDYYVSVNFDTFAAVVDQIGGVEVPVMEYEANAMGNLGTFGDSVRLNGEQALMFCRIRYSDSDGDVSRTRRQRQFITALIRRCGEIDASQTVEVVKTLLKYVKTDCPATRILSYATKALVGKWYTYEVIPITVPTPDFRMDYMGYAWVWIVDYPPLAQYLQDTVYGSSNILLSRDRVSAIDVMRYKSTGEARP